MATKKTVKKSVKRKKSTTATRKPTKKTTRKPHQSPEKVSSKASKNYGTNPSGTTQPDGEKVHAAPQKTADFEIDYSDLSKVAGEIDIQEVVDEKLDQIAAAETEKLINTPPPSAAPSDNGKPTFLAEILSVVPYEILKRAANMFGGDLAKLSDNQRADLVRTGGPLLDKYLPSVVSTYHAETDYVSCLGLCALQNYTQKPKAAATDEPENTDKPKEEVNLFARIGDGKDDE